MISTQEFLVILVFRLNSPFILAFEMSHEDFKSSLFVNYANKYQILKENMRKSSIHKMKYNCLIEGFFNGENQTKDVNIVPILYKI